MKITLVRHGQTEANLSNILHLKEQLYIETAAKKQITLNYQIAENAFILADPLALDRIMTNLIDNAIKYTPKGGEIDVKLEILKGDKIELSVKDTGVGISKKINVKFFLHIFNFQILKVPPTVSVLECL